MRRLSVRLRPEIAEALDKYIEKSGQTINEAISRAIMRQMAPSGAKSSQAREKLRFCIKERIQIEPLLSPRGYDEHPFFNDPAFKSSWETYEQVREEMGKKISRQIAGAILAACDDMGIDKAKVALNRAAQGGHVMVIPPTGPRQSTWVDLENESRSDQRKRVLLAEYGP